MRDASDPAAATSVPAPLASGEPENQDHQEIDERRVVSADDLDAAVRLSDALNDFAEGWRLRRIWWTMAMLDVKRRYRRTILGPFWATASHAIFIFSMGFIFANLWKMDISDYLPYLASGFVIWIFVSTSMTESCGVFFSQEGTLKQTSLPYTLFVFNLVSRNLITLGHHLTVFVVIVIFFPVEVNWNTLWFIPGIAMLCITSAWVSILLGMICARFRDVTQLVVSFLQIVMFVTPIFWPVEQMSAKARLFIVEPNLIYHAVSIARMPMIGEAPPLFSWLVILGLNVVGWSVTIFLFAKFRRTLVFWL